MKKISNTLLYPLVLGIVCLVCGTALAVVNYITEPVIAEKTEIKANQALYDCLDDNSLTIKGSAVDLSWADGTVHTYLNSRKEVTCTDSKIYYYYNVTTGVGYSGAITFGTLVSPNANFAIIGYKYISTSEDTVGTTAAQKLTISSSHPYTGGSLVAGDTIATGASAKKTLPALQTALEAAIADAKTI